VFLNNAKGLGIYYNFKMMYLKNLKIKIMNKNYLASPNKSFEFE
jgi:hypothetical protein